jgi:hypothetical protein
MDLEVAEQFIGIPYTPTDVSQFLTGTWKLIDRLQTGSAEVLCWVFHIQIDLESIGEGRERFVFSWGR